MIDTSIPLVDLHRHLDGNVRVETIWELGHQHGIALPAASLEAWHLMYRSRVKNPAWWLS